MIFLSLIIVYLFIFIFYLADYYCYDDFQMYTKLSFPIFFPTTILALIGKNFTLLLLANCETINICILAHNNYSLRNNYYFSWYIFIKYISSFNFRLNSYYFCIKLMYLIFFLCSFSIINNEFKALEGKCSNQTQSMSILKVFTIFLG
jgi:hypothetical protein